MFLQQVKELIAFSQRLTVITKLSIKYLPLSASMESCHHLMFFKYNALRHCRAFDTKIMKWLIDYSKISQLVRKMFRLIQSLNRSNRHWYIIDLFYEQIADVFQTDASVCLQFSKNEFLRKMMPLIFIFTLW